VTDTRSTKTAESLKQPLVANEPITTIEQLHAHLYQAAQVELSTIPLYLYAAYSIKTGSEYQWEPGISAFRTIRSVVIEEMLHLCLVRNLLLGTGAPEIRFHHKDFIPTYPSAMLHRQPELMLHLETCTPDLMQRVFMPLEQPQKSEAPPQADQYNTLGQFYAAIKEGLWYLDENERTELWKEPRVEYQYYRSYWNQDGGGDPIEVNDLRTAIEAIDEIVEQGEGANPEDQMAPHKAQELRAGPEEFSHYAKFQRIAEGIDPIYDTWPLRKDPKVADFDSPVRELGNLFNAAYCYVLCMIDTLYSLSSETVVAGKRSPRYGLERTFIAAMGGLLFPIADLLVRQPTTPKSEEHAGPTFELYPFGSDDKKQELIEMCDALLGHFPSLGGDDGVRQLLEKLPEV
jgi:ferritin-like protein